MRRLAGALTVFALVAVVVVAYITLHGSSKSSDKHSYWVELDNAFGLVQGGDMKVAGVRAGKISSLDLDPKSLHARVKIQVTQTGFGDLRSDASCESRPQSLIGEYFLDCDPGVSKQVLKSGGTIPVNRTSSTIAPDLVNDVLRRPYKERLALIINELGAAVAGNPQQLNEAIKRLSPGLRETDKVLAILASQNRVLANLARDGDTVLTALSDNRKDVARFIVTANNASSASATRKLQIAQGFARLPGFLAELRPAMRQLGRTADQTTPALRNLDASAGQLQTFLNRLGPFATASTPALQALGRASVTGSAAVASAAPTVQELSKFASGTPELAKNLSMVLGHLDSRQFATEADPRSPGGQGYTGLEDLLKYVFYQATSTNIFDQYNHLLSVSLFASVDCSPFPKISDVRAAANNPNNPLYKCISWNGPTQPGITTHDPTAPAGSGYPLTVGKTLAASRAQPQAQNTSGAPTGPQTQSAPAGQPGAVSTPALTTPTPAPGTAGTPTGAVKQVAGAINGLLAPPGSGSQFAKTEKPLLNYLLGP